MILTIFTPHKRDTMPSTMKIKKNIAITTVKHNLNNGINAEIPKVIIVVLIKAKQRLVLIIRPYQSSRIQLLMRHLKVFNWFRFFANCCQSKTKEHREKIIGNNSPEDNASNILVGTIFTTVSIKWFPYVLPSALLQYFHILKYHL